MREVVLDASVVLEWFAPPDEGRGAAAAELRRQFEAGDIVVHAPRLLKLEVLNVAGRKWAWAPEALIELARALDDLPFEVWEPELAEIAEWMGHGLTAHDAEYVAVAGPTGATLITGDQEILAAAPDVARPLG